jgi:hypothetical protein
MKSISVQEWIQAEEKLKLLAREPQPKGSITVEQFSKLTNPPRALSTSRQILLEMKRQGLATSQPWRNGLRGTCHVYFLKKK